MRWWFGLALLVGVGCAPPKAPDPVAGHYVGWQILGGTATEMDGLKGMSERLWLKADGTFTYDLKSVVMMNLLQNATGTWTHSGTSVTLTGTEKGYADDGYKNSPNNGPYSGTLTVESGMLVNSMWPKGEHYLRREGEGAPPVGGK